AVVRQRGGVPGLLDRGQLVPRLLHRVLPGRVLAAGRGEPDGVGGGRRDGQAYAGAVDRLRRVARALHGRRQGVAEAVGIVLSAAQAHAGRVGEGAGLPPGVQVRYVGDVL